MILIFPRNGARSLFFGFQIFDFFSTQSLCFSFDLINERSSDQVTLKIFGYITKKNFLVSYKQS